jgi:hypothetical protein
MYKKYLLVLAMFVTAMFTTLSAEAAEWQRVGDLAPGSEFFIDVTREDIRVDVSTGTVSFWYRSVIDNDTEWSGCVEVKDGGTMQRFLSLTKRDKNDNVLYAEDEPTLWRALPEDAALYKCYQALLQKFPDLAKKPKK